MTRLSGLPHFAFFKNRPPGEKRFLVLVLLTGLLTGLAAVALVRLMALVQKLFWGAGRDLVAHAQELPALHRLLAPAIGGLLVGIVLLLARHVRRSQGTVGIIEAVARGKGYVPPGPAMIDAGSIVLTVGSGGSLGREGGLVQAGAALGSWLGRRFHLTGNRLNILVGCGFAAGIAAAYNAPIGGALFALEVVLGTFTLETFGPIVVASAMGTLVSRALISRYTAYAPPPVDPLVSGWEIGQYILLGIAIGVASVLFIAALRGARRGFDRIPIPFWTKPLLGFTLVGAIGIRFPHVFGNGYDTVNEVLREAVPLGLVLVLPILKVAATALTRGCGGAGGIFTPTLFIGSLLGSAYGSWSHATFPESTATPGAYALVGMGAMLAGTTQAPLTAILMIFDLTGEYAIILPLMVACTATVIVCRLLGFESIYTQPLVDRGVRLGSRMEELVMDRIEVRDLMRRAAAPIDENERLVNVVKRMREEGRKELFVVGDGGRFRGAITLADLSSYLRQPEELDTVRAAEVLYADVPVLHLGDRVSDAIDRWARVSRDRLPVVDGPDTRRLVGELSAGDIFSLYSQEILHKEARLARFVRTIEGARPETTYVELPGEYVVAQVTLPASFTGATIRDLGPRARFGVNIIEIKRPLAGGGEQRIIPDPAIELRAGDGLIVVGRPADIEHLGDPVRLAAIARAAAPPA